MVREFIAVYILASKKNGTLYIGVTADLFRRTYQHRTNAVDGFTKRHAIHSLVYYEPYDDMASAIHREKRLKKYTRQMKINLIEKSNPEWRDLYEDMIR